MSIGSVAGGVSLKLLLPSEDLVYVASTMVGESTSLRTTVLFNAGVRGSCWLEAVCVFSEFDVEDRCVASFRGAVAALGLDSEPVESHPMRLFCFIASG